MIRVTDHIALDESELVESFIRASGPGGQNVNKLSTAVQLRFDVRRSSSLPDGVRARLERLAGKSIGDLAAAEGRATAETLAKNGCPVRRIHLERIDEASLGELLMHFMLETIIAAHLFGVDPFDQPAVEEGKVLAKRYLSGG